MNSKDQGPGEAQGGAGGAGGESTAATEGGEAGRYLRTQFLDRVAHDIRSPCAVLKGALDELDRGLVGAQGDQRAMVQMARRALQRFLRLADRLTLLSEMEGGPGEVGRSRADLRELLQIALGEAQDIYGRKGVQVELVQPEEPLWVLVEPSWLKLAMLDVLGNAMRHASSRARVEAAAEGSVAVLRVEDDGVGIAEAEAEALFRRFTPRPQGRGMGVSLSLAADVARLLGGELLLDKSRLPMGRRGGPGAAFVLRLPLEDGHHARRD